MDFSKDVSSGAHIGRILDTLEDMGLNGPRLAIHLLILEK
jgi:hypothetical protein